MFGRVSYHVWSPGLYDLSTHIQYTTNVQEYQMSMPCLFSFLCVLVLRLHRANHLFQNGHLVQLAQRCVLVGRTHIQRVDGHIHVRLSLHSV